MLRQLPALFLATLLAGAPLAARAADSFTPAQRAEIVGIVRTALKADPSILRDAVGSLQVDDDVRAKTAAAGMVRQKHAALFDNAADPFAGNPRGNVSMVEFYDPRCPYCRRVVADLATMLKRDPQLKIIYKDVPVLGPASVLEVRAILAAHKQHAYLPMQAAIMADSGQPTETTIRDKARALGLDADKLIADMGSADITNKIQANLVLAREMGVTGTPTFVIGDQVLPGAQDMATLVDAIGAQRLHAK